MDSSIISDRSYENKQPCLLFWRNLPSLSASGLFGSKMLVKRNHGCIDLKLSSKSDIDSQDRMFWLDTEGRHLEEKQEYTTVLSGNPSSKHCDTLVDCKTCGLRSCDCTNSSLWAKVSDNLLSNLCGSSFHSGGLQGAAVNNLHLVKVNSLAGCRPFSLDLVELSNRASCYLKLYSRLLSAIKPSVPSGAEDRAGKKQVQSAPLSLGQAEKISDDHLDVRLRIALSNAMEIHSIEASYLNKELSFDVPSSLNLGGELRPECCQNSISKDVFPSYLRSVAIPCDAAGSLSSCQKEPKASVVCESDTYGANPLDVTSFHRQSKSCGISICSGKVRFLCRRKNSLKIKNKHTAKISFGKRCAFRMDTYSDDAVSLHYPFKYHASNLSSFLLQLTELEVSDDSSWSDDQDCCDGASTFDFFDGGEKIEEENKSCAQKVKSNCDRHHGVFDEPSSQITYSKSKDGPGTDCEKTLKEINVRWNKLYKSSNENFLAECDSTPRPTLVRFSRETSLVTVLNEVMWADDYAAARRGSWVQDRMHFDRRIKETEKLIGWVLCHSHRAKLISARNLVLCS